MSPRQEQVLIAIIEQYAEVAAPVGSVTLAKLFGVSPATIRAEMADLEELGMLMQIYTSSGRVPTDRGYRFYVNKLQNKPFNELSRHTGRALEARLKSSNMPEVTIKGAVDLLVDLTQNLGLATIGDSIYLSGLANLFAQPEFSEGNHVREVASLLDNLEPWLLEAKPNEPINVFIGRENPVGTASGCSLIISKFNGPFSANSYIGVLGPTRQNYAEVMSLVQNTGKALESAF